jgi:transcriptional adapter 3
MPPNVNKGLKSKNQDHRRSRSRNTTPSVNSTTGGSSSVDEITHTELLGLKVKDLKGDPSAKYDDILEHMGDNRPMPDGRTLGELKDQLKTISVSAENKGRAFHLGMTDLSKRRREIAHRENEKKQGERERELMEARRKQEDSKKRKADEKSSSRHKESRPLAHGAHGVARQDGGSTKDDDSDEMECKFLRWAHSLYSADKD